MSSKGGWVVGISKSQSVASAYSGGTFCLWRGSPRRFPPRICVGKYVGISKNTYQPYGLSLVSASQGADLGQLTGQSRGFERLWTNSTSCLWWGPPLPQYKHQPATLKSKANAKHTTIFSVKIPRGITRRQRIVAPQ